MIERHEAGGSPAERKPRARNYDAVTQVVVDKIAETKGRMSAKRLLPLAVAAGYEGSGRNFRRLVAEAKTEWRRSHHRGRRPAVWTPGEHLVIDWGVLGGLHVFCAVLAWSRVRFVRFAADERAATTFSLLAECFETLGGVPKVVLADRMACLRADIVAGRVVPTPDYVRFASHYRFRPDFCEGGDPESKGIVENLVGYAKSDLMIGCELVAPDRPGTGDGDRPGTWLDLVTANAAAARWCTEVNAVTHSEIAAVPAERLAARELALLGGLPALRPRVGGPTVFRKVDRLSCIRHGSARYSVPSTSIGDSVEVRVHGGELSILTRQVGTAPPQLLACHPVVGPGEVSILDAHYPAARPATPARAVRPRTATEKAFCALGPAAQAFLTGAAAAGSTRLSVDLAELVDLGHAHGPDVLLEALTRATAFRRWRAEDVRSILAAGHTPTPRPAGDALVVELPAVPTRSLNAYKISPGTAGDAS